jgi:uncharacterized membrane protein
VAHEHEHLHVDGSRLRWVGLAVVVAAVVGLAALWPRGAAPDLGTIPVRYVDATVVGVLDQTCPGVEAAGDVPCREVEVELTSGPDAGTLATFVVLETQIEVPDLGEGDTIVVRDAYETVLAEFRYGFHDVQRTTPLVWLAVAFAVAVIAFGRWQGVRALVGLALGVVVLAVFLVPALLRDEPAVLVALVAGVAVTGVALYLAHGFTAGTTIALLGSLASLVLVTLLALVAVRAAGITGLGDDESQVLSVTASALDLRGLLVAGIVVGVLGSLDDVTVTQVATVAALRRTDPTLGARALYGRAIRVGRDHVAASVNTLVLAYAGASLPLLLLFAQGSQSVGRVVTGEVVAIEVIRMLVGSIGLVAAVPLTTALAAVVIVGPPVPDEPGASPREPVADPPAATPRWEDFGPPT